MQGLVVVICSPSQGGKDFVANRTMEILSIVDDFDKTSYATSYKVRESRKDDPSHIRCFKSASEIPVPTQSQISSTIYDTQTVVYDESEILEKLAKGEIVFVVTANPALAKKFKQTFRNHCFNVFIKRQQVNEETMLAEDLKRHGIDPQNATEEEILASTIRVKKRIAEYKKMKDSYIDFVNDETLGADYIFINWHTLIGGEWSMKINEKSRKQFDFLAINIYKIYKIINSSNPNWKEQLPYLLPENLKQEPLTLQDEWIKYLEEKHENE